MNSRLLFLGRGLAVAFCVMMAASCERFLIDDLESVPKERKDIVLTKSGEQIASATTDFTFSLMRCLTQMEDANANFIVSPLSLHTALSMAAVGAEGQTRDEMMEALGMEGVTGTDINSFYSTLIPALLKVDNTTKIAMANSLWVRKQTPARKEYVTMLKEDFNATVHDLDSKTLQADVNRWVKKATDGMIDNMKAPGQEAAMMLMNALYFNGIWKEPFEKKNTSDATFFNGDGSDSNVPFMNNKYVMRYFANDRLSSVCLPYGNGAYIMTLVLPAEGISIAQLVGELDTATWKNCVYASAQEVEIIMPRFECEYVADAKLMSVLKEMGIYRAFSSDAQFGGITDRLIYISDVAQKTKIKVNEKGTEAATISQVIFGNGAALPSKPVVFRADHPFFYAISEVSTGAVLFSGIINKL